MITKEKSTKYEEKHSMDKFWGIDKFKTLVNEKKTSNKKVEGQMFVRDQRGMVSWNLLDKFQMSQMFEVE